MFNYFFQKNVATVSSVDQAAISSIDLDIATKVEDEVKQVKKQSPTTAPPSPPKGPPKPPGGGGQQQSVASFVSAVDQPGVSSVDKDVTRGNEKKFEQKANMAEGGQTDKPGNVIS